MIDPALILEAFRHVGDDAWLKSQRWFVAEGRLVVKRLLSAGAPKTLGLLVSPAAHAALEPAIAEVPAAERPCVTVIPQAELEQLTGFRFHRGCLAVAERVEPRAWTDLGLNDEAGLILVLERVRDPDNLGSLFRNAAAFGAAAILIGPECADPFYRKTVRTSMGTVVTTPWGMATPWPQMLARLRAAGRILVALTPEPGAESLSAAASDLRGRVLAVLVGSEAEGLSAEALACADRRVRIPMAEGVDSLNVATATAVALYELTGRQGHEGP